MNFISFSILLIAAMVIIPLPAMLLDIFIGFSLFIAIMLLVISLCTKKGAELQFYPSLFLLSIIFSLSVNVSAIRLILTKGTEFDDYIIKSISSLFTGAENEGAIIGFTLFFIIFSFFAIVVTKGCTRISEVAARFTLDSCQVKCKAVDLEYENGAITHDEAIAKKYNLLKESNFYCALDGASKFLSSNVKIGIIIMIISFIGAVLIGILKGDETIDITIINAAKTYLPLIMSSEILCIMLPSFLLSISIGCIISRLAAGYKY